MTRKRPKARYPWWRQGKIAWWIGTALTVAVVATVVWVLASPGGVQPGGEDENEDPSQYGMEPAPPFTLPTLSGDRVSLSDHLGRHNLLLFFNEGVGCAPCFLQIVDLEKDWKQFQALDVELVSIMVNPISELAPEARRLGVTGEESIVAVDVDRSVSNAYQAMEASMHPGIKPGHSLILVNKAGQIIWRWDWSGGPMYVEVDELYRDVAAWLERAG